MGRRSRERRQAGWACWEGRQAALAAGSSDETCPDCGSLLYPFGISRGRYGCWCEVVETVDDCPDCPEIGP